MSYIQVRFVQPWRGYHVGHIGTLWDTEAEALMKQGIAQWSATTLTMDMPPPTWTRRQWLAFPALVLMWAILLLAMWLDINPDWLVWVMLGASILLGGYLLLVGPAAAAFGLYLRRQQLPPEGGG